MRYRALLAMLSAALLSSVALAQTRSRFDLTGNVSFGNAEFAGAPSGSQLRTLGFQTSGTSHFNRWLGFTSQLSSGYAPVNSIQLAGFTGSGTVQHYAMLVGPRITFASRSRFRPFIEGLGGTDYALTRFTSNGTVVKGRDFQSAYSIGGGTQIGISRRVGLNIEAHYFETQHTVEFLGWMPARLQLSAGLVFRLSSLRDRRIIADEQPPAPSATSDTQTASVEPTNVTPAPVTLAPVAPEPVTTMVVTASTDSSAQKTVIRIPVPNESVHQQSLASAPPITDVSADVAKVQPIVVLPAAKVQQVATTAASAPVPQSRPLPVQASPTDISPAVAKVQPVSASPVAKAPQVSEAPVMKVQPALPTATVASVPQSPVRVQAQQAQQPQPVARPVVSNSPAPVATVSQTQPQYAAPLSLGEYARRLREKKQRQQ